MICLGKGCNISFDSKSNAETFKNFYADLAMNLVRKLPFNFTQTTEEMVLALLQNIDISKDVGLDNLGGRLLKDGATELSLHVTQLINLSIKSSVFPEQCKIAKLKPLFKKGSALVPKNYRPISLLPLLSKLFEKIIHMKTQDYLNEKNYYL